MAEVKFRLQNPIHFIALGAGSGLAPKAPGTFGTLAAVPLVLWMQMLLSAPVFVAVTLLSFIFGVYICDKTAKDVGVHDHPAIVWDEVVGLMITMFLMPVSVTSVVAGFVLFRFFDIVKPWPIKWLDAKVKGGFGIMIDDVLAGVMAWLCMWGIFLSGWL